MKAYAILRIVTLITSVCSAEELQAATETPAMPENPPES